MPDVDLFPIHLVALGEAFGDESMGSKKKFWCRAPDETHWLFKYAREGTGEHWSEKVAAHVGSALGVPVARVELGECDGEPGSLSLNFATATPLVHGNELLQEIDDSYPAPRIGGVRQHSVSAVLSALENTEPPVVEDGLASGADWFVGYLLLDAVILNSDRHHENWAVLQLANGRRRLAPSYDHASGLGRELSDANRSERLASKDSRFTVDAYASKARSGLYGNDPSARKPLHPIDAFFEAARQRPTAGAKWLARVGEVRDAEWVEIMNRVPTAAITEPARQFALAILRQTTKRIVTRIGSEP